MNNGLLFLATPLYRFPYWYFLCFPFQHDCQEFLALLLDTFHEQLNQISVTTAPSAQPLATATDTARGQGHLNNEDLMDPGSSSPGKVEQSLDSAAGDVGSSLRCPETLSSEEEPVGPHSMGETSPRSSQGHSSLTSEAGPGRSSLKRAASSSPAEAVMSSLISEDSNHSTVSAHSTDSEQSSAFKRLKIESDGGSPSSLPALSSVSEAGSKEASSSDSRTSQASAALPSATTSVGKSVSDDSGSTGAGGVESMEMSPPTNPSIPQRKCVRLDIPAPPSQGVWSSSPGALAQPRRGSSDDPHPRLVAAAAEAGQDLGLPVGSKKFNNTERSPPASLSPESPVVGLPPSSATHHNDLPTMTSSPQDSSQTNPLHFYCKETKTLNTNVLVSNYAQGDVTMDSEKFAKVCVCEFVDTLVTIYFELLCAFEVLLPGPGIEPVTSGSRFQCLLPHSAHHHFSGSPDESPRRETGAFLMSPPCLGISGLSFDPMFLLALLLSCLVLLLLITFFCFWPILLATFQSLKKRSFF